MYFVIGLICSGVFTLGMVAWATYLHNTGRALDTEGGFWLWLWVASLTVFVWPLTVLVGLGMGLGKYLAHNDAHHDKGREVK